MIGERWTAVIIHELLRGPMRYGELHQRLPGISTSLLADRLRKLESAAIIERQAGTHGSVVLYGLTQSGQELGPVLRELRSWGVRYLYQPPTAEDATDCFDVTFVDGFENLPDEEYEWRIDGETTTLRYRDGQVCQRRGPAEKPVVVSTTSAEFMRRWAEGTRTWDEGRVHGDVRVRGSEAAWKRMQAATGYLREYPPDEH